MRCCANDVDNEEAGLQIMEGWSHSFVVGDLSSRSNAVIQEHWAAVRPVFDNRGIYFVGTKQLVLSRSQAGRVSSTTRARLRRADVLKGKNVGCGADGVKGRENSKTMEVGVKGAGVQKQ